MNRRPLPCIYAEFMVQSCVAQWLKDQPCKLLSIDSADMKDIIGGPVSLAHLFGKKCMDIVCTLTCPEGKPFVVTLKVICDLVGENIVPNRPDMHMRYFKYKLDSLVDVCLYVALCERFDDMCYATWRGSRRVHAGSFVYRGQRFLRKQKLAR
jgi:hypothetical protein